jgi:hypothetical protein
MDNELARLVDQDTPKLNPLVANGLAVEHMKHVEKYVDQVFHSASRGFPEGLVYHRGVRCTPQEEFDEITKKKNNRSVYDVAPSNMYMMKYLFSYKGEMLPPRYLYLPFVGDAGTITIGGSHFNISPILSDRVISVGVSNIFVRLLRDRLTLEQMPHHYMEDGKRETEKVSWSLIYHKNDAKMKKVPATVKANTTLVHYLFNKYGFTDTFLKFGNCRPVIGGAEVNKNVYPEDDWVICMSTQVKPKGTGRGFYEPSNVRIAVRKDEMTPMVRKMLAGFFYITDHFPSRVLPEYVDDKRMWMILMGHILFSGNLHEGRLYDDIADHMTSLDDYLDGLVVEKLREIGFVIDNVYQLFALVVEKFNDWILGAKDKVASMYDKELSILYYVLYEISSHIFKLYFKLKAASKKELTAKEINATMNLTLRTGLVYAIVKSHGEVSNISVSGDNKAFKVTSLLIPQGNSSKMGAKKDKAMMNDPSKRLHVSVAEVGGYSALPKSAPDGRSRLNPCVNFDAKGVITRNPKFIELLDGVQEMIKRKPITT